MTDLPVDVLTSNNASSEMNDTPEDPATSDSQSPPQFCMQTDCVLMRRKLLITEAKVNDTLHEKARVVEEALSYKTRANKLNMQLDAKIKELRDNHTEVVNNYDEALDDARHKTLLREGEWEAGKIAARESLLKLQEAEADIAYKQALLDRNRGQFERGNARIAKLLEEQVGYKKQISEFEARLSAGDMKYFKLQNDATAKVEELTQERNSTNAICQEFDHQLKQGRAELENMIVVGTRLEGDISELRAQLDAEVKAKSQLSVDLNIQERKVTELENQIHAGDKAYHELRNDRDFRVQEVADLKTKVSDLEQAKTDFTQANIDLETAKKSLEKTTSDLKEANAILETERISLGNSTTVLERGNSDLKHANATFETEKKSLEKTVSDLKEANKTLETEKRSLEHNTAVLKQANSDLKQANTTLEMGKKSVEKKLEIFELTNSNNSAAIVALANSNNEASNVASANSSIEPLIAACPPLDTDNQHVNELLATIGKHEDTIWTLQNSINYLRTSRRGQFVQELQENIKAMEEKLDGLKAELSDANTRAEKAAKDANQVAMDFELHKFNATKPALNKVRTLENVIRQRNRQDGKAAAELRASESQVDRLRSTNCRLKSELAFMNQREKVPKQPPVLTEAMVTCVYSCDPSPSDGNDSPALTKPCPCQAETEEKKPHHRGKRGGRKKNKKPADQSAIVTPKDSDISNTHVTPQNSNNENDALEEQTIPEPDANVGPAVSNIEGEDSKKQLAAPNTENEAVEEQTIPEPDANVTALDSNISEGNVGPAISNIKGEDAKEQLTAPSQGENDNVTPDVPNNEETASNPKTKRNRRKPVLMNLKTYKFVMSRIPSYAHYAYTPIFFIFISLFLTLSLSRTFNPVATVDYQPGLFLVSPLPPNALASLSSEAYEIYSPPTSSLLSLRTPAPTPTCPLPPTSTSPTSGSYQSRCAYV
jgi:chromosome segregation ATPase